MTLLEQIKEAGTIGYGRVGFPTHVKLNCTVEYLIINTTECEPLLRTDHFLILHKAREIIMAAGIIGDMVQTGKHYIVLKEAYPEETTALEAAITELHNPVKSYKMKNFYPAGDEQIMICDVTGRAVPPSGIPLDIGAMVSNLAIVYPAYNASRGQPFTEKYLMITGAMNSPCAVRAPLGTSFAECLLLAGGSSLSSFHIIADDPMMGKCYRKEEAAGLIVTKATSGYIIVADDTPLVEKHNIPMSVSLKRAKMCCVQCSYCTQMYPRYLTGHPLKPHMTIRKFACAQSPEEVLEDRHVRQTMICSERGPCETYVRPMGLQPRQVSIYIKDLLRQNKYHYSKPSEILTQLEERSYRKVPSKHMAARLGVDRYYDCHIDSCKAADPAITRISLRQHIGAPSQPAIQASDAVLCGQLIEAIPAEALGANVHVSISETVVRVTDTEIVISADRQQLGGK